MDEGRPLTDHDLDREIQEAFAVQPSPEFLARVRQRAADEPAALPWPARRVAGFAAATAFVIVTALNWPEREQVAPVSIPPQVAATATATPGPAEPAAEKPTLQALQAERTRAAHDEQALATRAASRETARATANDWDERFSVVMLAENERKALQWFGAATQTPRRTPAGIVVSAERAPGEQPALRWVSFEPPDLEQPAFESVRLE